MPGMWLNWTGRRAYNRCVVKTTDSLPGVQLTFVTKTSRTDEHDVILDSPRKSTKNIRTWGCHHDHLIRNNIVLFKIRANTEHNRLSNHLNASRPHAKVTKHLISTSCCAICMVNGIHRWASTGSNHLSICLEQFNIIAISNSDPSKKSAFNERTTKWIEDFERCRRQRCLINAMKFQLKNKTRVLIWIISYLRNSKSNKTVLNLIRW